MCIRDRALCQAVAGLPGQGGESPLQDTGEEVDVQQITTHGINPSWHELLKPCAREDADKATIIRRTLKSLLGRWQSEAVLSSYKEKCLRIGPCGRYFINDKGETLRLAAHVTKSSVLQ